MFLFYSALSDNFIIDLRCFTPPGQGASKYSEFVWAQMNENIPKKTWNIFQVSFINPNKYPIYAVVYTYTL